MLCMNINALSLFLYNLDFLQIDITKVEKNRVIRMDIIKLDSEIMWISVITTLGRKVADYKVPNLLML